MVDTLLSKLLHLSLGNLFSVTQGGLAAGCNADYANAIQHDQDMISTTQTGAVRCCSFDGESCKSKIPDCSTLSFSKAQQKCSEFRMRLCTKEELSNNICCGTGCSFDLKLVWYTKGNLFCSSIKILMQKAFLNLESVILNGTFAESGTKIPQTPPPRTTVRPGNK